MCAVHNVSEYKKNARMRVNYKQIYLVPRDNNTHLM